MCVVVVVVGIHVVVVVVVVVGMVVRGHRSRHWLVVHWLARSLARSLVRLLAGAKLGYNLGLLFSLTHTRIKIIRSLFLLPFELVCGYRHLGARNFQNGRSRQRNHNLFPDEHEHDDDDDE